MHQIYGTMLCKDCVACAEALTAAGVPFAFHDFGADLENLKVFLRLRDQSPLFDEVRAEGGIGIPCVVREDGSFTLDWESCLP